MEGLPVEINDVLTAPELDALILRLAMQRAAMSPPVPMEPPQGVKELRALNASFTVTPSPAGLLFRFRSEAFGWITYEVPAAACLGFQDWFAHGVPVRPDRSSQSTNTVRAPGTESPISAMCTKGSITPP